MNIYFHVAPKFTPGSPAQVDEQTAMLVADQEREAFLDAGHDQRGIATTLEGIAYSSREKGGKQHVSDLITGAEFVVPNKAWEGKYWYSRPDRDTFRVKRVKR